MGKDIISAEESLKNKFQQYLQQKLPFINLSKYILLKMKKIMNFNIRIVKNWYDVENVLKKIDMED